MSTKARPVYSYNVPESVGSPIKTVGMVELTGDEQMIAHKAAREEKLRLAHELIKRSLWEIDGVVLKDSDGSRERAWKDMGCKVQDLCSYAYDRIHHPREEEGESFLASMSVKV